MSRLIFALFFMGSAFCVTLGFCRELPVETFFKNPQYMEARISPDGQHLGVLAPVKDRVGLAIIDLKNKVANWAFADRLADVMWFEWANNDRLILGLGKNGYLSSGMLAINRDATKRVTLAEIGFARKFFLSFIPDSPNEILVSAYTHPHVEQDSLLAYPNVERVNILTDKAITEVTNPGHVWDWVVDQTGAVRVAVEQEVANYKILYRAATNAPWTTLAEFKFEDPNAFFPVSFQTDNRNLLVSLARDEAGTEALYNYDVESKSIKELAFRHTYADYGECWISRKNLAVVGVRYETERPESYWFAPEYKQRQASVDRVLTNTVNLLVSESRDGNKTVFLATSDRTPGTYYLLNADEKKLEKLFDIADWIHLDEMAETKPIEYTARDGLKIHGYLTLPRNCAGTNLPMVVNPHGGPWARDSWTFDPEVQFFANRGFAVLRMNFRGSTGYGWSFLKAGFKEWGLKQQDDITDGVKWAIAQGIADPKRVAIYGGSYGGYATLVGLEKTPELYRCGICYAGVTDVLRTVWEHPYDLDIKKRWMAERIGDPRKDKARLETESPVNHADQIQAPVFLAYGLLDDRVPIATGRELASSLRKRGKLYDFMVKNDEGHGFHKEENRIEFWKKADVFLKVNMN